MSEKQASWLRGSIICVLVSYFLHPLLAIENFLLAPVTIIPLLDYKLWEDRAHVLSTCDL